MKGRHIAVYSGSFNPLHIGHLAIMKHLVEVAGFDMVYIVVSPKNPLKEISGDSARERYNAAVDAVIRHFGSSPTSKVKVDDIELNMSEPYYTIRTLDAIREREPQNNFTLIMGADNLAYIRHWKDYQRILTEYGAAVYPRKGFNLETIIRELVTENPHYLIRSLDAPVVDISSTEIRASSAAGTDMSKWLM